MITFIFRNYQLFEMKSYKLIDMLMISTLAFTCSGNLHAKEYIKFESQNNNLKAEIPLSPIERQWLKKHDPIKVAVKKGWMPIEFQLENQLHRGYAIDYLEKIANLYQINFEIVDYSDDLSSLQPDIISSVSGKNINDTNFHLLSQPFLKLPYAIYVNKNNPEALSFKNLENLSSAKVAIYKKATLMDELKNNYPALEIVPVDIADEAFNYLKFKSVDAYVGNEFVIDYHIEVHRLEFVEKVGLTPFTSEVRMAIKNNEPELSSIMEKATTVIGQNNQELISHWINKKSGFETTLKIILASIFLTFTILSIRFYQFKSKSRKELKKYNEKIWRQANFDFLTNLPNRHQFQNNLKQAISSAEESKSKVGLIFIDLDDFKQVNDTSGHSVGDKLLKTCASRITDCVRESDHIARLGGDEFMIVVKDFDNKLVIESICKKVLFSIESPFEIDGKTYFISGSIGITLYPDDSYDSEELVQYADQAMYESKKLGKNRYQFFNTSLKTAASKKAEILSDLRIAIKNKQFELYYQPIVRISDKEIVKAEALIRWNHPHKGTISPSEFIQLAEESGLIVELGNWIFDQSTDDLILICEEIKSQFHLSINVSPFQFTKPESLINLIKLLSNKNISANQICLEITEGLLLEPSSIVIETINTLSKHGVKFAIDDFGTGYSALAYLQKFKISFIKIDKSFTHNLVSSSFDQALCGFIIQMANKLGIQIIAEGVEVLQQNEILDKLNCEYGQGYLYGKPMPLKNFLENLTCITPIEHNDLVDDRVKS